MDAGSEKNGDFYSMLGLKKECSDSELRNAYKKLALRWHPDRCTGRGKTEVFDEAKEKFQEIQEAYSILSDSNKRFLYDVGVYDSGDDGNGMGEFFDEMAQMTSQTKGSDGSQEIFEDLQQLFVEMFQGEFFVIEDSSSCGSSNPNSGACRGSGEKRGSSNSTVDTSAGKANFEELDGSAGLCFGPNDGGRSLDESGGSKRNGRKGKISSKHDVSSNDAEISA